MNYKRKRFSSGACHPSHTSFAAQQQRPRLTALVPLMRCTDLLPRYASFLLVVLLLHISTAQAFVRHVNNCPGYTSWSSHWLGCNKIAYSRGGTRSSGRTDTVASTNDEWRSTSIRDDESHGSRAFPDEKKLHSGDSLPVDRDHWHENETTYRSNEQHEDDSAAGLFQNYNVAWLGQATTMMLDRHEYPTGTLTDDDWKVLKRLMAEWPRQRSVAAAMTVEQLIKRAVEEVHSRDRRSFTSSPSSSARQSTLSDCSIETSMYVSCLNAWAWSGDTVVAAIRAQSIHDEMTRTWRETGNSLTAPSTASYNALLNAWSKYKNSNNPVLGDANSTATSACLPMTQSESILLEMIKGGENVKPDDTTVMTLLNVYAKSFAAAPPDQCRKDHVQRCGQLVEVMQREWRIQPSVATYLSLQRAYARSGLSEASLLVERVIHTMLEPCAAVPQQLGSDGAACVAVQPTTANFNALFISLSKHPSPSNAIKANSILRKMELSVDEGGFDANPNTMSYALAILTCGRCSDSALGARYAEALLEQMEKRALSEANLRSTVSRIAPAFVSLEAESFNVVLTAISQSRQRDAPERAMKIVQRMEQYFEMGNESVRPTTRSWNAVLNSMARASGSKYDIGYARSAEAILELLSSKYSAGDKYLKPDAFTYTGVLSAFQKSKDPEAALRAEAILRRMEEMYECGETDNPPDTYHYTILCGTWARSGNSTAASRVLQILSHMKERDQAGYSNVRPNTRTFNAVLDCLARARNGGLAESILYHQLLLYRNGDDSAKPDTFSFNCVIQAHTGSNKVGAGRKAEMILDRLHEYEEEENPSVRPDARSFNLLISFYAKSKQPDSPYRAEYILNRMISRYRDGQADLVPSIKGITQVIDSYANMGHPDAGRNADRMLKILRDLKRQQGAPKNFISTAVMNSVLFAWSNSGDEEAGFRAENYLDEMEASFQNGVIEMQPDSKSYTLVISAWSKSSNVDKFRRALLVLRRMEHQQQTGNMQILIDEHPRSLVINACAFSNFGGEIELEAFNVACTLFDEILNATNSQPTSLCFGWFIQAMGRLDVEEERKTARIEMAFRECCNAGLVNEFVLHRLKGAAPLGLLQRLIQPANEKSCLQPMDMSRIPQEWTQHCLKQ